jgi:sugar phosphate isomerase/epimerase
MMKYSRRDFGKTVLGGIPMATAMLSGEALLSAVEPSSAAAAQGATEGRGQGCISGDFSSNFAGVQIGNIVPYSYHGMSSEAHAILSYLVQNGISACEMMSETAEPFAGAPAMRNPFFGRGPGRGRGPAAGRRGPFRPPQLTPAQQAAMKKQQEAMTKWRLSVPMSKYEELRKLYNDQGVHIYGFKLQLTDAMPDAEFDYAFKVVKALGADQLTMEMPGLGGFGGMRGGGKFKPDTALTKRIGQFADKYKTMVGYHAHTEATPTLWDEAMDQSPYNGINLDIGWYVASGYDPIPFIRKNHARITSMHLKDRDHPPTTGHMWGEGQTPLKEALELIRDNHYTFPCAVEVEYPIPKGSNSVIEAGRCVAWAKNILLSNGPGIPEKA